MMRILKVFVLVVVIFTSCSFFKKEKAADSDKGQVIARVFDNYLYEKDLEGIIKGPLSTEDSLIIVRHFIDSWIKEQLVYFKALKNLNNSEKDKKSELDDYYRSLIKYEYQSKIVRQRLNNQVSEEEIEDFFNKNKEQFQLRKCIVRLIFLKVSAKAPDIDKVRTWITSQKEKEIDYLYQYCRGYAVKYSLDDRNWVYLDDLTADIPLDPYNCDLFSKKGFFEYSDSNYIYLLNITDYRHEGEYPPIEFETERIKSMILYNRKNDLIEKLEKSIFDEGLKKNYFTIYEKNK